MKILLASSSSGSRGGGEIYLVYLGEALRARGHEVQLWMSDHPQMDELGKLFEPIGKVIRSSYRNTYHRKLRSLSTLVNYSTASRIAEEWNAIAPDIIHINKQNLEDGLDLLRAAGQVEIPSVATIHLTQSATYLGAKTAGIRDWAAHYALAKFPGPYIAVQEQRAKDLNEFLDGTARVEAIHNGVPLMKIEDRVVKRAAKREELGYHTGDQVIMQVGRLMPQKRPFLFLEYARRILAELPGTKFLWVGSGILEEEWDMEVKATGLDNNVRRIGWTNDVYSLLAAGDVFLHVAEYEGMPLAVFEAMAAGLPCILSLNLLEDMPFLKSEHAIGADVDADWESMLTNIEHLHEIGIAGRELVEAKYSREKMAENYENLYRTVLEEAR